MHHFPDSFDFVKVPWPRGGTQLGQHREYLLHGRRYASCIHAEGLSCYDYVHTGQTHSMLHILKSMGGTVTI